MGNLFNTLKGDYLQRSRSYAFLITVAIAVYAAHSFVPTPEADYTTLNIPGYKGVYNSAWAGNINALMTTVMLSLCGFYLVNSTIKKDIDTEVGLIIATTPVSNFGYLFIKFLGNLMILLTISGIALLVGIVMFFIRNSGYPFYIGDFLRPYFFMVVPAMVVVSGLAITAEVFLSRKTILQNAIYFLAFTILILAMTRQTNTMGDNIKDAFGTGIVTSSINEKINKQFGENIQSITLGYIKLENNQYKTFEWDGALWDYNYLISRLIWVSFTFLLVYISSLFFHRFDFKQAVQRRPILQIFEEKTTSAPYSGFQKSALPEIATAYGIIPFVKIELMMMIRKDAKWLWLINLSLWVASIFLPLEKAYSLLLPALFFLQVNRISDLTSKEVTNRLHYFTFASYKPLQRLLPAQVLAGLILLTVLAMPVIFRLLFSFHFISIIQVLNGIVFIVALSVCLGVVSGGRKLFEIFFFVLTYIAYKSPGAHYLGNINTSDYPMTTALFITSFVLLILSFVVRKNQIKTL
ncbi:hypothetical protein [Chryseobacterium kwangjuense]|uniref:Uncharacterized protein n=1 Tax=Chryseobacterium kwangjuense TaxID=267125 RepID=A0A135WI58_9FLAO|nr:hypothetical protein [Chryseobacterium kwangjuense]KXH84608.1 hypothetical protein AU378_02270 [Chryseobacterium kwangjuense]